MTKAFFKFVLMCFRVPLWYGPWFWRKNGID